MNDPSRSNRPLIVGIGGTFSTGSSTERALKIALGAAEEAGAGSELFDGASLLSLPHYGVEGADASEPAQRLIEAIRRADGLIVASPGYHGSISGLVKNALDYIEATSRDERCYLDGLPVGLIATAFGWQASGTTMTALRSIIHALRGWPTPMGAAINTSSRIFTDDGCSDEKVLDQLRLVGRQVVGFAKRHQ